MGNIQSAVDLENLLTSFDDVSGTYDIIVTYAISHLVPKYLVELLATRGAKHFLGELMMDTRHPNEKKSCMKKLATGSQAEGFTLTLGHCERNGIRSEKISDVDMMIIYDADLVEQTHEMAYKHKAKYFIYTSETYPGFARVKTAILNANDTRLNIIGRAAVMKHGTTDVWPDKIDPAYSAPGHGEVFEGPALNELHNVTGNHNIINNTRCVPMPVDKVHALPLKGWPKCIRKKDWRHDSCLGLVVDLLLCNTDTFHLFYLVCSSHFSSKRPLVEWRFSCSLLEVLLCYSLTVVQRQVYLAFKYLVKQATKDHTEIKTYYLKTTLLWTVETAPSDHIWCDENLAQCLYLLLDKFIHFLTQMELPNFFILENNLIGHLSKEQVQPILDALQQLRRDPIGHIMKFQRLVRLHGHCLGWEFAFEVSLLPAFKVFQNILDDYKDVDQEKQMALFTMLMRYVRGTMLDVCKLLLEEYKFEEAFQTLMAYQRLSEHSKRLLDLYFCRPSGAGSCPEEDLYRFFVDLFQQAFGLFQIWGIEHCLYLLKYMHKHLEKIDLLSMKQKHLLRLLEALLNTFRAFTTSQVDKERGKLAWDQCAIAYEELVNEQEDVITLCEYLCFFAQLWQWQNKSIGCEEFIHQARKISQVLKCLISAISSNRVKGALKFNETWKRLLLLYEWEMNIFFFVAVNNCCREMPHEIVGVLVAILTIRTILLPKAESFLLQSESCQHQQCKHQTTVISDLRELLKDLSESHNTAAQWYYLMVLNYGNSVMQHPEHTGKCNCYKLFLVSLMMMYMNDWEGAVVILSKHGSQECCKLIRMYLNICILVLLYRSTTKKLASRDDTLEVSINNEGKCCHSDGLSAELLYDCNADMSTYGHRKSSDERIFSLKYSNKTIHEVQENRIILKTKEETVSLPYDRIFEDYLTVLYIYSRGLRKDFYDAFYEELKSKTASGWVPETFEDMLDLFNKVCKC